MQRERIELVDDLDGKPAQETVSFALDGVTYRIDLSTRNAAKLRAALEPYIAAGTKLPPPRSHTVRPRSGSSPSSKSGTNERAAIRTWAFEQGHTLTNRGRIPKDILAAYHAHTKPRRRR